MSRGQYHDRLLGKLPSSRQIKMLIIQTIGFPRRVLCTQLCWATLEEGMNIDTEADSFKFASLFISLFFFSFFSSRFLWRNELFLKIHLISCHSFILCKKFLLEIPFFFFFVDFYFLGEFITFLMLYIKKSKWIYRVQLIATNKSNLYYF